MASTTSAAASMLQSPSSTTSISSPLIFDSSTTPNDLHALNFSDCSSHIPTPFQHYFSFPNSSISASNSHPTITLDLTAPPPNSAPIGIGKLITSSNFSPLQSTIPQLSSSPAPWNSTCSGNYLNYGTLTHNHGYQSSGSTSSLLNSGKQPFQGHAVHQPNHLQPSPEAFAVTANSKFQSALAAALTTYLNNGGVGTGGGDLYTSSTNGMH